MSYTIFADESGTSSNFECYSIGALLIPSDSIDEFNNRFRELIKQHGVVGEVKWKKIANSHGQINFGIDILKTIIQLKFQYSVIVVKKSDYRKWQKNKEEGFYTTYCLLFYDRLKFSKTEHIVYIDHRYDSYDKQNEVVEIITNHMLNRISSESKLIEVLKTDSQLYPGIQVVDIITGAINAAHNRYLNPGMQLNKGKQILIKRLAKILGLDNLCYDTYPEKEFNIWNFPFETYRAKPATKKIVYDFSVPYVLPSELNKI
jgi:hypothetical protein